MKVIFSSKPKLYILWSDFFFCLICNNVVYLNLWYKFKFWEVCVLEMNLMDWAV